MRLMPILLLALLAAPLGVVWAQAPVNRGIQPIRLPNERGEQVELYRESHALVIGVSDYTAGWPRLSGAVDDVNQVRAVLEPQGFKVETIIDPDRDRLEEAFDDFIARYGRAPENRLLFYFAGHGYTLKLPYGGDMGYIVPVDCPNPNTNRDGFLNKAIDMYQVEGYARRILSKHALFMFDCCFSGSIFALSRAVPDVISYKTSLSVRQFITSGSADEKVPDQSIFNRQFISALAGAGDLNRDGFVTGAELGQFLQDKVVNYSRNTQHPQYGTIRDENLDKGDFVFQVPRQEETLPLTGPPPKPPDKSIFSVEDLKKKASEQEALKAQWAGNLAQMRKGLTEVESLEKLDLPAADKALAWQRFLDSYVQDNPFSGEDEALRQQARKQLEYWRNYRPVPALEKTPEEVFPPSPGENLSSLTLKAAAGDAESQCKLGIIYAKGDEVPEDFQEALKWFRLAADQGYARAQYDLGLMHGDGRGVPQDDGESLKWFRKAADQGYARAQYNLSLMYLNGKGVPQDDGESLKWRRKAADQGYAEAQLSLGLMYDYGLWGVPQDDGEALKWYRKAADQGYAEAQFFLGRNYNYGSGVPQDYAEALKWYRLAADQGYANAQFNLGLMYKWGRGVPQDDGEAIKWYRLAAEQGYVGAQYRLGVLYDNGQGVPQDYVMAHMWLNLAASNGYTTARENLESLVKKMSPTQIAQAQELARNWKPKTATER